MNKDCSLAPKDGTWCLFFNKFGAVHRLRWRPIEETYIVKYMRDEGILGWDGEWVDQLGRTSGFDMVKGYIGWVICPRDVGVGARIKGYIISNRTYSDGDALGFGYSSFAPSTGYAWDKFLGPRGGVKKDIPTHIKKWSDAGFGPREVTLSVGHGAKS